MKLIFVDFEAIYLYLFIFLVFNFYNDMLFKLIQCQFNLYPFILKRIGNWTELELD